MPFGKVKRKIMSYTVKPFCETCEHWYRLTVGGSEQSTGNCHFNPPVSDHTDGIIRRYPLTYGSDWCSKHEVIGGVKKKMGRPRKVRD